MSKPKSDAETLEEELPVLGLIPIAQGFPDAALTGTTTFSDTLYTSRTLILPDNRTLAVVKGVVSVSTSDDLALNYLKTHAEFELLKE